MRTINAGIFDTPILIEELTLDFDDMGTPIESWAKVYDSPSWGKLEPLQGLVRVEAGKATAHIPVKLTIRTCPEIDTTHRIMIRNRYYDIDSIEDYGRNGFQVLWIKAKH
jgi:SPP1 family predicted phage head-tail adaptor